MPSFRYEAFAVGMTAWRGSRWLPFRVTKILRLDRDGREIVPVLRRVHEPFYAGREEYGLQIVDQRNIGGVRHDLLVCLAIELGGGVRVRLGDRLVQQPVDLRVVVPARVETVGRPRVAASHDAGPRRHGHAPADLADADLVREAA